jgi:hypothetical protein
VTRNPLSILFLGSAAFLAACGSGTEPGGNPLDCATTSFTNLQVGDHIIIDAAQAACVRLPAAGSGGAEYIYAALATDGQETTNGETADYELQGSAPGGSAAVASVSRASLGGGRAPGVAEAFHAMLRARERALSEQKDVVQFDRGAVTSVAATKPSVGDQRTFDVCATTDCNTFVQSTATAKVVGNKVAIFLDDSVPSGGYLQADLDKVGALFDSQLYPIDTTAFGRETDLDNNSVVIVLLTPKVNALTPDCNSTGSVILGYFFGLDLLPSQQHSNDGEVFYGLVPDPGNSSCDISKAFATNFLPPTFIHEFQHMISFGQHVVMRQGSSELTWLNEGLSHFAEELGGRLIPDAECQPAFTSCRSQFLSGDVENAYDYLNDTESSFLIEPGNSTGTLAERGANWLFVRWLADHFAATQPAATEFTRAIDQTNQVGVANVEAVTGANFSTLVGQWQLANYLDNLPGFTPLSDRLQYTSFDFRALYQSAFTQGVFPKPYPLTPDVAGSSTYSHNGTLRGGSGRHVDVVQPASSGEVTLLVTDANGTTVLPTSVKPRAVLARIR